MEVWMIKVLWDLGNHSSKNHFPKCCQSILALEYYDIPVGIAAGILEEGNGMQGIPRISVPDSFLGKYACNRNLVFMHVNGESMNKIIQNGVPLLS
jgi:repressor LexA